MVAKPIGKWTKLSGDVTKCPINTVYLYIDEYGGSANIHAVYIKRAANRWLWSSAEGSTDAALTTLFALVEKEHTKKAKKWEKTNVDMQRLVDVSTIRNWKMRRYELADS